MSFTAAASHVSGMTVKTCGQARQGASAGFSGCRGAALTQSRNDSGVYTGLTMRHQCGLYEKHAMPGVKCRTDA
ncbi:hypothetical protein [Escherichia coli]|uniref:hypothetical protein n=1 Tax=Escherichia coli TaxID=562 RepID=UPI001FCE689A|nr:hypothetical protein [Escherichia coli]